MSLRDQLTTIYEEHGRLTPKLVVDLARDETHPLHNRFEWDDSVAGEKYRQVQAAVLFRSVRVNFTTSDDGGTKSVRAFHSVPKPTGNTYVPLDEVTEDPFTRQIVLKAAEREWKDLQRRYAHLAEFLDIVRKDVAS